MTDGDKCGEPAPIRVNWPGREPLVMCATHAEMAERTGAAMGLYVHLETLASPGTCQHARARP